MRKTIAPQFSRPADRPVGPITVPTLVEKVHEHLLSMLASMEIAPGARVPVDAVARSLSISQTPVREALSRLEAEGLVNKVPNVGYRASPQMTAREVDDLFVLRLLIEPHAAARAAESMDEQDLRQLAEIGEEMASIRRTKSEVAYARFADSDAMLHRLVAIGSGNRLIADAIERLHVHMHIFRILYNTNAPEEAAAEHARIIDAVLKRDPKKAEAAMREHLEASRVRIEAVLNRISSRGGPRLKPKRASSATA